MLVLMPVTWFMAALIGGYGPQVLAGQPVVVPLPPIKPVPLPRPNFRPVIWPGRFPAVF